MVGIDIVYIPKFKKILDRKENFLNRFFSEEEQQLFKDRAYNIETITGNFAVKEAFLKAVGIGMMDIDFRTISVLRKNSGKPYIKVNDERYSYLEMDVSISHDNEYTVGIVYIVGRNK